MFCFHKWSLPIGNNQVCEKCGLFKPIECLHKWSAPVDNRQTCEKCGLIKSIPCSHKWIEKDTRNDYYGIRSIRFACEICGQQKQEKFK